MALNFGFFNSVNGDRRYDARWFAKYFASFIGNGVFPNPSTGMQVVEGENMTIIIKPGQGWINGYYADNDTDYAITLDNADGLLNRIDRIVLRWNQIDRVIEFAVKKGAFASNAVAPAMQRDGDYYELVLADVLVNKGATQITQANITDTRLNKTLCGIVHGTVNQVDTTTLYNQYLSWWNDWRDQQMTEFEDFQTSSQTAFDEQMQTNQTAFDNQFSGNQSDFNNQFTTNQTAFNEQTTLNQQTFDTLISNLSASFSDWMTTEQQDFYAWYQGLQDILDENIAATLTAKLQSLEQAVTTHLDEDDEFIKHKAKQISVVNPETEDIEDLQTFAEQLFTNVSNGKNLIGTAITDVDESVVVPSEPSFAELASAIGDISTGVVAAYGEQSRDVGDNRKFIITGLDFEPKIVVGFHKRSSTANFKYSNNGTFSENTSYYSGTYQVTASFSGGTLTLDSRYDSGLYFWIALG